MVNKNLFFTVAFGSKRYKNMALALKKSFLFYNPNFEFKIFDEKDFTSSDKFLKGRQVDYVLGQWTDEEFLMIQNQLEKIRNVLLSFVMSGVNSTMNQYNGIWVLKLIK